MERSVRNFSINNIKVQKQGLRRKYLFHYQHFYSLYTLEFVVCCCCCTGCSVSGLFTVFVSGVIASATTNKKKPTPVPINHLFQIWLCLIARITAMITVTEITRRDVNPRISPNKITPPCIGWIHRRDRPPTRFKDLLSHSHLTYYVKLLSIY